VPAASGWFLRIRSSDKYARNSLRICNPGSSALSMQGSAATRLRSCVISAGIFLLEVGIFRAERVVSVFERILFELAASLSGVAYLLALNGCPVRFAQVHAITINVITSIYELV